MSHLLRGCTYVRVGVHLPARYLESGHADVDRIEKEIQAFFLWQSRIGL